MAYLTLEEFKLRSNAPPELIDALETHQPGWVGQRLESNSRWVDSRLRKRYAAPFDNPYPETVKDWTARLTTLQCFLRRGVDPADAQFQEINRDAEAARDEVLEAANAEIGLFDLPLRSDTTDGGVTKGRPLYRSEASPFVWRTRQRERGREQDR